MLRLPRLYAIIDTLLVPPGSAVAVTEALLRAGVRLLQYRHKGPFLRRHWEECRRAAQVAREAGAIFLVNDRADMALLAGADGVHLGQQDLPPEAARRLLGELKLVGFSTHSEAQARRSQDLPVDYLAIGPVFPTTTKENPDPVVGLEGIAATRRVTDRPLVAIGGITRQNARQALAAGADAVAVAGDLLGARDIEACAREFLLLTQHWPNQR